MAHCAATNNLVNFSRIEMFRESFAGPDRLRRTVAGSGSKLDAGGLSQRKSTPRGIHYP
jgi:hypothetical protein